MIDNLTEEQRHEIYLQVRRMKEKAWRDTKQSQESKTRKRDYMREYMRKRRNANLD